MNRHGHCPDYEQPAPDLRDAEIAALRSRAEAAERELETYRDNVSAHKRHIQAIYAALGFGVGEVEAESQPLERIASILARATAAESALKDTERSREEWRNTASELAADADAAQDAATLAPKSPR